MTNRIAFARCAAVVGVALALSSCGADTPTTATPATATPASTVAAQTSAVIGVDEVLAKLTPAGATKPVVVTAETDPNKLLGRPGQYTARGGFDLPGGDPEGETGRIERGGIVEIHPDAAAAAARAKYIADSLKANPILGVEYHYPAGPVLVRVTGKVTPANAKKVEDVVATLPR